MLVCTLLNFWQAWCKALHLTLEIWTPPADEPPEDFVVFLSLTSCLTSWGWVCARKDASVHFDCSIRRIKLVTPDDGGFDEVVLFCGCSWVFGKETFFPSVDAPLTVDVLLAGPSFVQSFNLWSVRLIGTAAPSSDRVPPEAREDELLLEYSNDRCQRIIRWRLDNKWSCNYMCEMAWFNIWSRKAHHHWQRYF